jgi:hypothetical protein
MRTRRIRIWALVAGTGLLVAAAIFITYRLGFIFSAWQPIRPHGISAAAVYVSTVEDGYWFDCRVDNAQNVDVCRVWDYWGKVMADGRFQLECEERAATSAELRPSTIARRNGLADAIYLFGKDGNFSRKLVSVERARESKCQEESR